MGANRATAASPGPAPPDDLAPSGWGRMARGHVAHAAAACGPRARWARAGPEDGPPALVIPGFLATDRTTMELRRALAGPDGGPIRGCWGQPWRQGQHARSAGPAARASATTGAGAAGRVEPGRAVRARAGFSPPGKVRAVVTLGSPFSGDLKTNTNVRELYERIAGHDVNQPPFEVCRTSRRCRPWLCGHAATGSSRRAPPAALPHEVDKAVEIDTAISALCRRPALSRVVAEIRTFLTEVEAGHR